MLQVTNELEFKFAGVLNNRGFKKYVMGKITVLDQREANLRESTIGSSWREVRETEGSRNQGLTSRQICSRFVTFESFWQWMKTENPLLKGTLIGQL